LWTRFFPSRTHWHSPPLVWRHGLRQLKLVAVVLQVFGKPAHKIAVAHTCIKLQCESWLGSVVKVSELNGEAIVHVCHESFCVYDAVAVARRKTEHQYIAVLQACGLESLRCVDRRVFSSLELLIAHELSIVRQTNARSHSRMN